MEDKLGSGISEEALKGGRRDALVAILAFAIAGIIFLFTRNRSMGEMVQISVDGVDIARYSLRQDREEVITGARGLNNHLIIRDGKAWIEAADCPDKLCVREKPIERNGEMIVCLPNKVIVRIVSGKEAENDAISQ